MGKVMRHTLGASLNIRHNLSSSKGPKPLQLKLLTTYIPKTSAFRSEERFSRNAETDLVCRLLLEKKKKKKKKYEPNKEKKKRHRGKTQHNARVCDQPNAYCRSSAVSRYTQY